MKTGVLTGVALLAMAMLARAEAAGAAAGAGGGAPGKAPGAAAVPGKTEPGPAAKGSPAWKEAEKLVAEWMADPRATLAEMARIQKLIVEMGADEYRKRQEASRQILKYGEKALPALEKAVKSKDPEVATRAQAAVEKIRSGSRRDQIVSDLREKKVTSLAVIDERIKAEQELAERIKKDASTLMAEGKRDESLVRLKAAKASIRKALKLADLRKRVSTDDPLAEIKKLVDEGKHAEALRKLQLHTTRLKKDGKLDPARAKQYQELIIRIFQGMKGGLRGRAIVD